MKFSLMPYTRPDVEKMMTEGAGIAAAVRDAASVSEIMAQYEIFKRLSKNQYTLGALVYIRHSIDTTDEFYDKENDFFDENGPLIEKLSIDFYKEMVNSSFRVELEKELGDLWFIKAELRLKGFDDKIIEEMQKENALCSKYDKLLASASLDFDGKKLNLSQLRAYQLSPDRDIRKAAYSKRTEFFLENEAELDEIFDELVKLRHDMAKKLGYTTFTELGYVRMQRNSYDAAAVKRFRDQVKKVLVPFLSKLHEQRQEDLGVEKLKFFDEDIFYATGNPTPKGTPEEMFEAGEKMYDELSAETKEFFDYMQKNELFDVLAKEGKSGGGYCHFLPDYGSPYIFANFNGTSEDVDVLTHECGHALCAYMARNIEIYEYQDYSQDIAEIHSMAMEFFTADWMKLFFKEDTEKFLYMQLAAALAFIPYGCMVDEFQHIVYDNPDMSPAERKAAWSKLENEYKPHLDYDGDPFFGNGGMWQRQAHIYLNPFYYIDYCLAETCAIQYRIWMEENTSAAWKSYIDLLVKAGTRKFTDVVAEAGLKSPFESGCMESLVKGAEELLAKLR
ncbi:MAG: M3 family oligoendopeptidase [Oscillospiraceae bacterium]|jgi:M3 family oligoendopeptidase|nr:M3 family oligoendopeptidase [Oscillospiraceae bacterium]